MNKINVLSIVSLLKKQFDKKLTQRNACTKNICLIQSLTHNMIPKIRPKIILK